MMSLHTFLMTSAITKDETELMKPRNDNTTALVGFILSRRYKIISKLLQIAPIHTHHPPTLSLSPSENLESANQHSLPTSAAAESTMNTRAGD